MFLSKSYDYTLEMLKQKYYNISKLKTLLEHKTYSGVTPLHCFPYDSTNVKKRIAILYLCLKTGMDINITNNKNESLLHHAVFIYDVNMTKILLEFNIDINIKNINGFTASDMIKEELKIFKNDKNLLQMDNLINNYKMKQQKKQYLNELKYHPKHLENILQNAYELGEQYYENIFKSL
jgi:hypothetical protein